MILAALLALQQLITPPPPLLPTPVSVSERETLDRGLRDAESSAHSLGALLGVSIEDVTTGVSAQANGEQPFPLAGLQRLAVAVLVYRAADAGTLQVQQPPSAGAAQPATIESLLSSTLIDDDRSALDALMGALHGPDSVDTALHALALDGIFVEAQDGSYASPNALMRLLLGINRDSLLSHASNAMLLDLLRRAPAGTLLGSGLPRAVAFTHLSGRLAPPAAPRAESDAGIAQIDGHTLLIVAMLRDGGGTQAQRDRVFANIAATAVAAATANADGP